MEDLWKGIAICGIWIGAAGCTYFFQGSNSGQVAPVVCALLATGFVAIS